MDEEKEAESEIRVVSVTCCLWKQFTLQEWWGWRGAQIRGSEKAIRLYRNTKAFPFNRGTAKQKVEGGREEMSLERCGEQ